MRLASAGAAALLLLSGACSVTCGPGADGARRLTDERIGSFVRVEGGGFIRGADGAYPEEGPPTRVFVSPFLIQVNEVTNAEFAAFVDATGYVTEAEQGRGSTRFVHTARPEEPGSWWRLDRGATWRSPDGDGSTLDGRARHPVVHVTLADARAYARWAGGRLPTEVEWEYAASLGLPDPRDQESGVRGPDGEPRANVWEGAFPTHDSARDGFAGTAPVGSFPASRIGTYDMIGNVWELTESRFGRTAAITIKGGSFLCSDTYCRRFRPAARGSLEQGLSTAHVGFRVVKDLPAHRSPRRAPARRGHRHQAYRAAAQAPAARTAARHAEETPTEPQGVRLAQVLDAPGWARFGLEQRLRLEHLDSDVREGNRGASRTAFGARSLLWGEVHLEPVVLGLELLDARAWAAPGTRLDTTIVNPLDVLSVTLQVRGDDVLEPGDALALTFGRMTLELGSRRLLARNEFRNTINAFTGAHLHYTSSGGHVVRAFLVVPVARLPELPEELVSPRLVFDTERTNVAFWGLHLATAAFGPALQLDASLLGLHESDAPGARTANRQLVTASVRLLRSPARGELDLQLELFGQTGSSHRTTADTDRSPVPHLAASVHATLGYSLPLAWLLRGALVFDWASGDGGPDASLRHRFDPLFAARRFELGPTGLYGLLSRANLLAPAVRVELHPVSWLDAMLAFRSVWLASPRDAWVVTGLQDPTGASGTSVGQQLELRARLHLVPQTLVLEVGGAWLASGAYTRSVQPGPAADPLYGYTQLTTQL